MSELNIYQRINAVMKDCEYLQKKQMNQGKGIEYDEVIAMIRDHLIHHGVVMVIRQTSFEQVAGLEGKNQKVYQGHYEMDLINMDKPEEKVTHTAFAHGMDGGDKAPGKAHTYAVKIMLVKGFGIETGEDEESRSEKIDKTNTIDGEQYAKLAAYCMDENKEWTDTGKKLSAAYKISGLGSLPASKFEEALKRCEALDANS
jgi:hypothetical protein